MDGRDDNAADARDASAKALWCSGRNFIVNAYSTARYRFDLSNTLSRMCAREWEREEEGERELFFFFSLFFSSGFPRYEDHERIRRVSGIETFRNSDGGPLVSHATHQLNVNVCLRVRRQPRTFIDVRALSSRHWRATYIATGNKIARKRNFARCCSGSIVIQTRRNSVSTETRLRKYSLWCAYIS